MSGGSLADENASSRGATIRSGSVTLGEACAHDSEPFNIGGLEVVALRTRVVWLDLKRTAYPALVVCEYDDEVG